VVTGASGVIGGAIARRLAREGYALVLGCSSNPLAAEAVRSGIAEHGATATVVEADLSNAADVDRLFEAADRLGPLHGLVNAAAKPGGQVDFLALAPAEVERIWRVNFLGALVCCQRAAERMSNSSGGAGGRIVNISSQAASSGGYRRVAYATSKASLEALTVALASELAEQGILVNALAPGLIDTASSPTDDAARRKRAQDSVPLGRLGTPEEVADAVAWLMSPGSSYVTGAVIPINGGRRV
jgi:NAD(P)-dependent dehydrogenase (short-subunit alcohol dehydrogenase family)